MNTIGRLFKITIYGASHQSKIGVLIDGIPVGINICESDFKDSLLRRKPFKKGTSSRKEEDTPIISTGLFNNYTTGAPLTIEFLNKNINSKDYDNLRNHPRPGHSDFVANHKYYGFQDFRGGGTFSGRLTLGLVAAGVVAGKILPPKLKVESNLKSVAGSKYIDQKITEVLESGDSVGGLLDIKVSNMVIGLGDPFFDSLESRISHLLFSVPGIKSVSFGSGLDFAKKLGSELNDTIINKKGKTLTNHNGGINGGISNGNDLFISVVAKPTPSISKSQMTYNFEKQELCSLNVRGRHDCCFSRRLPVILESCIKIVLADMYLLRCLEDKMQNYK